MVRSGVSSAIRYPELEDRKSRSKVIHLSGDLRLASSKARKVRHSVTCAAPPLTPPRAHLSHSAWARR
jgi:hypothetical protein